MPKRPSLPRPRLRRPGEASAAAADPAADPTEPREEAASETVAQDSPAPTIGPLEPTRRSRRLPRPSPPSLWPDWLRRLLAGLAVLLVGALGFGAGYLVFYDSGESEVTPAVAPTVIVENAPQPEAAEQIGFPAFATRNTTRVGGADPVADGAGVALASYPSLGGVGGPGAVVIAPADDWQTALAATPLTAAPIEAPLLLSGADEVPELTAEALKGLAPQGLETADGAQLIVVGDLAVPDDLETLRLGTGGADPSEVAKEVDAELARLTGREDPDHLLVVSSTDAGLAMPAAAWAARSGDPILFADADEIPEETAETVAKHPDTPIYVLGPESAISAKAIKSLEGEGGEVTRVGAEGPVENAIAFARFVDDDFGWNINDPGHGFTIANVDRPLDASVGAPLAAGGKPGPLLLTDDPDVVPAALQGFLADTQPGFVDDPSRAVYNHIWLLGDPSAITVGFQAQIDELTKLAPVGPGTRPAALDPPEADPEAEPSGSGDGGGGDSGTGQSGR